MRLTNLIIAITFGLLNGLAFGQESASLLQPLDESVTADANCEPNEYEQYEDWMNDRIRETFSYQETSSILPAAVFFGSAINLRNEQQQTLHSGAPPLLDLTPPPARPLSPTILLPLIESSTSDQSRVVTASAEQLIQDQGDANNSKESSSESEADQQDQEPASTEIEKSARPDSSEGAVELREQIERLKKTIGSDEQVDKLKRTEQLERLTSAESSLLNAATFRIKQAEYDSQLDEYPAILEKLTSVKTDESELTPIPITSDTTADSLLPQLQTLQQELQTKENEFSELEGNIETLNSRITEIPSIRAESTAELEKTEQALSLLSQQNEDLDGQLRWIVQRAKQISLKAKLKMLNSESRRQELAGKVLPVKRDETSREIKRLKASIIQFESQIEKLRLEEVKQQAEQARRQAMNAHPAFKDLADRNQELTQRRGEINSRIQAVTAENAEVKKLVEDLVENKRMLEGKIEAFGGVTQSNGMLLVESRRGLVSPFESLARIKTIQAEQQAVNVAVLTLKEERKPLADPLEFVKQQMGNAGNGKIERQQLEETAVKFAQTKRQYLDDLLNDYNRYRGLLQIQEVSRKKLVNQIEENRNFIDEKALWVRNTNRISMADCKQSMVGARAFFDPPAWYELGRDLVDRVASKPHEMGLGACGLIVIVLMSRRLTKN